MNMFSQLIIQKKNSVAFIPQANYTDWRPTPVDEI
jgi:hypothetical protein